LTLLHTANIEIALFLFDGHFGRLYDRKDLVARFQVHSLD
jgi:hypothetical protein